MSKIKKIFPNLVVSSTGRRPHGYHTALAAQKEGMLSAFFTTLFYKPDHWTSRLLHKIPIPYDIKQRWEKRITSRFLDYLNSDKIICCFRTELFNQIVGFFPNQFSVADFFLRQGVYSFDKMVAKQLPNFPMDLFIFINDLCANYTLPVVKKLGGKSIMISVIPSQKTRQKIIQEELAWNLENYQYIHSQYMEEWFVRRNFSELNQIDFVIATSPFIYESIIDHGLEAEKIFLIPRGVSTQLFKKETRKKRDRTDKLKLLYVGRVTWLKGIWYLMEAMKKLPLEIELTIVGACDDPKFFQNASANVKFVPPVPHNEIPKYYWDADVFVQPSLCEGSPTVVAEAMAAGLPVIATTNSSGMMRDAVDGFIIPIRDVNLLREKILILQNDAQLRRWMGRNARERVGNFTWDSFRNKFIYVLKYIHDRGCLPPPFKL